MTNVENRTALLLEEERLALAILTAYESNDKPTQKKARDALVKFNKTHDYRTRKNK